MSDAEHNALQTDDFMKNLMSGIAEARASTPMTGGRPYLRLLKDGHWVWGPEDIEVEPDSEWAINTMSLQHGWVCWDNTPGAKSQKLGEIMISMSKPLPACPPPVNGQPFKLQRGFNIRCLTGEDANTEAMYAAPSDGGLKWIEAILEAFQRHVAGGGIKTPFPVLRLVATHYMHPKHGRTYKPDPDLQIVRWVGADGKEAPTAPPVSAQPAPAEVPAEPEKPATGRRRAAAAAPETVQPGPASTQQAHAGQRRRPAAR